MIDTPTIVAQGATLGRLRRALSVAGVLVFTVLWFALLAYRPLFDPDEGRYAEIPREMAAGGDWVIPHLDGLPYLEKPPLQYWLSAALLKLAGPGEFVARLWTGLAGYASLAMMWFVGYRLWGLRAGIKALFLAAASPLFVLLGHQLTLDMVLSTCLLGCLTCYLMGELAAANGHSQRSRQWMIGCWAAMALAVLTKGLIGLLIPAATLTTYAVWQRDPGVLRRLNLRWGVPLFLAIAAPWFVLAARANPAFLHFFFIREHFQRFLTPIENRTEPWWYFAPVLIIGILPWLAHALRALGLPFRTAGSPRSSFQPARVLWAWCVFVLMFFSASNAKLIPYILPAVPAMALLCAAPAANAGARRDLLAAGLLSLISSAGILAYTSGVWTSAARPLAIQLAPTLIWTAILLAAAGFGCLLLTWRNRPAAALAALCCGWFLASASLLVAANGAQRFFSAKDAALAVRRVARESAPVFSVRTYEQSFTFYLQRTVVLVDYHDEFALGLSQMPERGIPTLAEFSIRWHSLGEGYAIMQYRTWDALRAQGVPMRELARGPNTIAVSRR